MQIAGFKVTVISN